MKRQQMCRVCLVEEARMCNVVNKKMHEVYEKLTNKPFVTEDRRPVLLCYFCCTILKKCCRFQRKCLEAEELFGQILDEDYEPNPLLYPEYLEFDNGLVTIQMQHISIDGECETENHAVKKGLSADCERLDVIIEPKEELQFDELELENIDHSDVEDDVSITEVKIEVVDEPAEQDLYWAPVAKKAKLQLRRTGLQDVITEEQMKNEQSVSKVFRTTQNRNFKPVPKINDSSRVNNITLDTNSCNNSNKDDIRCKISNKDNDCDDVNRHGRQNKEKRYKCDRCQKSFTQRCHLYRHLRGHTGVKRYKCGVCQNMFGRKSLLDNHMRIHTGEKPFHCDICQRNFSQKFYLTRHLRIHTGEKPYKCEVCQYRCNQKGDLTKHIRIHGDEKPYKCDECQYSSNQKGLLINHIRKYHIRVSL